MRFIELHYEEFDEIVLLNIHNIITICKEGSRTRIVTSNGIIFVKESPDEIKIKIHG